MVIQFFKIVVSSMIEKLPRFPILLRITIRKCTSVGHNIALKVITKSSRAAACNQCLYIFSFNFELNFVQFPTPKGVAPNDSYTVVSLMFLEAKEGKESKEGYRE